MRTILGYVMILMFVPLLSVLIVLACMEWTSADSLSHLLDQKIPAASSLLPENSRITDKNGTEIEELVNSQNRVILPEKEISGFLKQLFVTSEDRSFYEHSGIDASAITRALLANQSSGSIQQGGSTITQQLARNIYLSSEKTYNRKLAEVLYAHQLERKFSKSEILAQYINAIYFQNGCYGIEAASRYYFSKAAAKLSKAEMAFLAAIPNNPSLYNPLVHFDACKSRQERLLKQMADAGYISNQEYGSLRKEAISLHIEKKTTHYAAYSDYVLSEFEELTARSLNLEKQLTSQDETVRRKALKKLDSKTASLLKSGITIETALDPKIQAAAEKSLNSRLSSTDADGASVVIQHHTQKLVSLTGGKNYIPHSFNRAFQSYRQPGSAIKPLLVYAPYIEETKAPLSETVSGGIYCKKGFCPRNYGGAVYGNVSLLAAFSHSYNTPAVRLLEKNGIKKSFSYLQPFRFRHVTEKDRTLAAAVGGFTYGISPLEMTRAFTSFYDGTYKPARAITKVTDKNGKVLMKWSDKKKTVWSPDTTTKMRRLLHETTTSGTAKKAYFQTKYIGGKTGTTNEVKDLWFVGLTDSYTSGVWIGKDKPASIAGLQQASPHLAVWKDINWSID